MPAINFEHIISVSSEDKTFPAENLLKDDGFKKWKCQNPGEKNVSVTLQFEKSSKIHQIDIGNEGSAFIEVLVGKGPTKDEDFKVILVASSFMTPIESRSNQNLNKVRLFGPEKLNKTVSDENWDRVKVVCTQPFNKNAKFGLAFIKIYAPPQPGEKSPPKTQSLLGAFKLKDSDASDDIKPGSLFLNRGKLEKKETPTPPKTGAAAIRAASKVAESTMKTPTPMKRKNSVEETPESKKQKHDDTAPSPSEPSTSKYHGMPEPKPSLRRQSTVSSTASSASMGSAKKTQLKRVKSETDKPDKEKRFNKIMEKVVFVLSGFENPHRGKLRDKALEMGATYKPDWGKTCTHLICAFKNTPKYNQVNGKGRIVGNDWVKDCYKQKKLLPWREYRLGKAKSPPPSESDTEEEDYIPVKKAKKPERKASAIDLYGGSTDENTDDEIERVKQSKEKERKAAEKASTETKDGSSRSNLETKKASTIDDDPYNAPTDEEGEADDNGLPPLPNFFRGKNFFLYGKVSPGNKKSLKRYITAYDGFLQEYMSEKTHFVLSESDWDENFDQATLDNPSLSFVRPDWVFKCHDQQKLLPFQKFIIVPM